MDLNYAKTIMYAFSAAKKLSFSSRLGYNLLQLARNIKDCVQFHLICIAPIRAYSPLLHLYHYINVNPSPEHL